MLHSVARSFLRLGAIWSLAFTTLVQGDVPDVALVISVAEQRMALLREGEIVEKFPISTSKFGLGDALGSYKTPLGQMRVCEKYGDGLPLGAVLKGRQATGEVLTVNAPGRDPIVTRILWLEGTEPHNRNARPRGIYIHGTPEEVRLGQPVSWGCIRMRSSDVAALFDTVPIGTPVIITEGKLPHLPRHRPDRTLLAAHNAGPDLLSSLAQGASRAAARRQMNTELLASMGTSLPKARGAIARAMTGSILLAGLPSEEPEEDTTDDALPESPEPVSPAPLLTSSLLDDPTHKELRITSGVPENLQPDAFSAALLEEKTADDFPMTRLSLEEEFTRGDIFPASLLEESPQ